MKRQEIKIGLFGFGCVGQGLYEVLQKTPGFKAEIVKICVKDRTKKRLLSPEYYTFDRFEILQNPAVNVIVELIDDADAAWEIVAVAMKNGKAVVSANKKMIAEHFTELLALQKEFKVPFLYEASCCASIPILRNLEEYYDNDMLQSLTGIVNGSTNYILTSCTEKATPYPQALAEAQEKGYAETNPALDVEGFDAKYKLTILLAHAFGAVVKPENIYNEGITRIGEPEIRYAKEKGYKIKLIAKAVKNDSGEVNAYVIPTFVKTDNHLFYVDDVYNGIVTETAFSDKQIFIGRGAGAFPTASAVLSDISALSYFYKYEFKKISQNHTQFSFDCFINVYLRWDGSNLNEINTYFNQVNEFYRSGKINYLCGTISFENIQQIQRLINTGYCIVSF